MIMALVVIGGMFGGQASVSAADTSTSSTPFLIQERELFSVIGQPVKVDFHVVGGTAPYRWSLLSSGLPEGVFLDREVGQLLGTPGSTGRFSFTLQVQDAVGSSTSKLLELNVRFVNELPPARDVLSRVETLVIDLDDITEQQLDLLVERFPDDAPLIYVGPNATPTILKVNIAQMRIQPNGLYRVEGGTPSTLNETHKYSDVYYVDTNGRRHAFPTEGVFRSWYKEDPKIESVPDWKISNIPLRKNVTFRPGTSIRLEGTREFYYVQSNRTLKKFLDEATYQRLASTITQTVLQSAHEFVSILPLAHVADYQLDTDVISRVSDMPTMTQFPALPGQEL